MRKHVISVSDKVQHKLGCATTEDCKMLEFLDLGSLDGLYYVAKTI